jgi:hypothetical protein
VTIRRSSRFTALRALRSFNPPILHGKSQEETPPEDEQAQAPKTLEEQSPQETYVAEVNVPAADRGGFIV